MTNFLETAKRRWPDFRVQGSGRYAIATNWEGVVRLFETRAEAESQIVDPRYAQVVDLEGTPVPEIRETAEDRYEERLREKRAKNAEKFRARY